MAQNPNICIVDDDEAVRDSLQVLLETMGYIAQAFESGPQFLEACGMDGAGCALIDMYASHGVPLTVIYLDTEFFFPETYALRDRL